MGVLLCASCFAEMYAEALVVSVETLVDAMDEEFMKGTSTIPEPIGLLRWSEENA